MSAPTPPPARRLLGVMKVFFEAALFAPVQRSASGTDGSSSYKYISLTSMQNHFNTDSLIIRPCYEHILPQIHNIVLEKDGNNKVAVTGTPGIGKSVFGILLIRYYLVERKDTVLYWGGHHVYMFSSHTSAKDHFGLFEFAESGADDKKETFYAGYWTARTVSEDIASFLYDEYDDIPRIVIHDPEPDERMVAGSELMITRLIYIVSHGHPLITWWGDKQQGRREMLYLPLWSNEEAMRCLPLLKSPSENRPLNMDEAVELYNKFGGCIRGWVSPREMFWSSLLAKVKELVSNYGANVLVRNTCSRGSIIHLFVEFDEAKKAVGYKSSADDPADSTKAECNDFTKYHYIFGSHDILEAVNARLINQHSESLDKCLVNWSDPDDGFECVYGALFELQCQNKLQNNRGNLKLKTRIVYPKNSGKADVEIEPFTFPKIDRTLRYPTRTPSILMEDKEQYLNKIVKNRYLWPYSSTHASYDGAIIVDGDSLALPDLVAGQLVGLLLQMTVSGASGLIRRPEHSVKQKIRKTFHNAFNECPGIPDYKDGKGEAITAFMVPSVCFKRFVFQPETIDGNQHAIRQPSFQIVFEMPGICNYKPTAMSPSGRERARQNNLSKKRPFHEYSQLDEEHGF